ncbi:MAG: aspartate/glutamate racemase family protein [Pyrinomonadaceae bacterium]
MKKLAIIDWGIGGISIYRLVKEELSVPVVYLSDTGATPYGKMTRQELVARLNSVIAFLRKRDVMHLVIGCNAASTAIPFLDDQGVRIEGMIENAVAASIKYKPKSLAVIGGRRTVLSGVYRKGFADHDVKIQQRIAQPLSALIESGDISSDKLRDEAKKILDPIKNCSHILLACTHYPAITLLLKELVSDKTEFIDPAGSLLQKIKKWKIDTVGTDEFFTTGDSSAMKRSAKLAFGVDVSAVKTISI